jgi:hypothetical protein
MHTRVERREYTGIEDETAVTRIPVSKVSAYSAPAKIPQRPHALADTGTFLLASSPLDGSPVPIDSARLLGIVHGVPFQPMCTAYHCHVLL